MSRVEELEAAISELPPDDFRRLAEWIRELDQTRWDQKIDEDNACGKLDFLFDEASEEASRGLLRDWPSQE
jgi:hypothetical protein